MDNTENKFNFSEETSNNQKAVEQSKKAVKKLPFPIVIFNFIEKNF